MFRREGFTLIEIIVVLIIIGVALGLFLPSFLQPNEKALSSNAVNNLLAIYSAEQNYYSNNNSNYCLSSGSYNACSSLPGINTALSLNIQDDGSYTYSCAPSSGVASCTAYRQDAAAVPIITVFLTGPNGRILFPISLNNTGAAGTNPFSGSCPGTLCPF